MKRVLTCITEEEKTRGISLMALKATYRTILSIDRYEIDKKRVLEDLKQCESDLQEYWSMIANKYKIPLYIDNSFKIDSENNFVYLDSKDMGEI